MSRCLERSARLHVRSVCVKIVVKFRLSFPYLTALMESFRQILTYERKHEIVAKLGDRLKQCYISLVADELRMNCCSDQSRNDTCPSIR